MDNVHPMPGFYACGPDQTFFVSRAGEVWQLLADAGADEVRVPGLPPDAEPFEREMPSMLLRMAARLGLTPHALRVLSVEAVDVLDELLWDRGFGLGIGAEPIAELAQAGLVARGSKEVAFTPEGFAQLDALSRAMSGRSLMGQDA